VTAPGCAGSPARRGGSLRALSTWAATLLLAGGCASLSPLPTAAPEETISGRLAVRVDAAGSEPARSFSAAFDLRGNSRSGVLGLSTPLGSMLAQARWSPETVTLATPQGRREFPDLDSLTREVLGESVPVEAWFDWLRGRPWPAAPSTALADGSFTQLGWTVDLARLADGRVSALREQPPPKVSVRIQLDAL
jgi:outer membrane lipoprotein LolB